MSEAYEAYKAFVESLKKPGAEIIGGLTPETADLMHMTWLLSGETGELADALKKYVIYRKPLDRENVIEELGDIEFALSGIRSNLGITRDETITANVTKLRKRYHNGGYSDAQAQQRADKD